VSYRILALLLLAFGDETWSVPLSPPGLEPGPDSLEAFLDSGRVAEPDDVHESLAEAGLAFRAGDHRRALELLYALRGRQPRLPPAPLMLARLYLRDGAVAQAREEAGQALASEPGYPGTHVTLGEIELRAGRPAEAADHLNRAIALAEADQWGDQRREILRRSYKGLANAAAAGRDWPAAKKHLLALLDVDAGKDSARLRLAQVLLELGDEPEAVAQTRRVTASRPDLDPPEVLLARMSAETGDWAAANRWMSEAVANHDGDPRTHRAMARWRLSAGDVQSAEQHVNIATTLDSANPETRLLEALIARIRKDHVRAEAILHALHQETPDDFFVNNQLAVVLAEQPDEAKRQRALHLAETNVHLVPDSPQSQSTLGWVYHQLGREEEAERALRTAISLGSPAAETGYYLAAVLSAGNRADEARKLLPAVVEGRTITPYREDARALLMRLGGPAD
jgi:predicted Zn-dependent protease